MKITPKYSNIGLHMVECVSWLMLMETRFGYVLLLSGTQPQTIDHCAITWNIKAKVRTWALRIMVNHPGKENATDEDHNGKGE